MSEANTTTPAPPADPRPRKIATARLAWSICGASFALSGAGLLLLYLNRSTVDASSLFLAIVYGPALSYSTLGALIAARRPQNPIGWLLAGFGLVTALMFFTGEYAIRGFVTAPRGSLPASTLIAWLNYWIYSPTILIVLTLFFLLFPNGRAPSRRWKPLVWLVIALGSLQGIVLILTPTVIIGSNQGEGHLHKLVANPTGVASLGAIISASRMVLSFVSLGTALACFAAFIRRFFGSYGDERQQLKWVAWVGAVLVAGSALGTAFRSGLAGNVVYVLTTIGYAIGLPGAAAVAMLKYRLYDIDLVISRTLVYGALAAFITTVYVGIVVGIGSLVGSGGRPNLALSIVATAVVAVAFQPVREWLQKVANRVVYGKRATPYEVLSEFSARVSESYAGEQVLTRMARVLAEGTGAEGAIVWLRNGNALRAAAAWPENRARATVPVELTGQLLPELPGADRAVPVRHQGELLGALTVKKRAGETLTPIEEKLLDDLAHQAGLVLKNVGLTADLRARLEDLRASRQRLVKAQDDERRKLERNLHDGAQQHLVAIKVKLGLAEMLAATDPVKAKQTLAQLKGDADEALNTLRDLARGIYPPLLADRGLVVALKAQAGKATVAVAIEAEGVGRYPQEVEAAVYFCALEALQNVQKYAHATLATVRMTDADGGLTFEVTDNGRGFDPVLTRRGSGLQNIADRLEALGGSLTVVSAPGRGVRLKAALPAPAALHVS